MFYGVVVIDTFLAFLDTLYTFFAEKYDAIILF